MFKKLLALCLIAVQFSALATQPPTKEQIEKYRKDGTLADRIKAAKAAGTHQFHPNLVERLQRHSHQFKTNNRESTFKSSVKIDPLDGYFPSTGTPKMLVLLVEFEDYPHTDLNSQESIESKIFGEGDSNLFPYDSQNAFYKRSSYNQLDIQGNVLDWYKAPYNRPEDDGNSWEVKQKVIRDAIEYHDALGHDFSQYDNNGDGEIDYVAVIWTGPTGAWASLWWGTFSGYYDNSFVVDGKTVGTISWQQVSYSTPAQEFNPSTLIHETGHALGLPDFYDYDDDIGPRGGVGRLDQMGGDHDHNAFSKFILGWTTPKVVSGSPIDLALSPSSVAGDSVIVYKDADETTKYDEFFIAEYRNKEGNDINFPSKGLTIWHIDATLNKWGWFENNNSYSDDKFIRLIQADGRDDIETNNDYAEASDLFKEGDEFSPNAKVKSKNNAGDHTGVVISDISLGGDKLSLNAEVYSSISVSDFDSIEDKSLIKNSITESFTIDNVSELKKLEIFVNGELFATLTEPPFEVTITSDLLTSDSYVIDAVTTNLDGFTSTESRDILFLSEPVSTLLVDLGNDDETALLNKLHESQDSAVLSDFIVPLTPEDFPVVKVNFGFTYDKWQSDGSADYARPDLSNDLENRLLNYLDLGGKLIIEGQQVFAWSQSLENRLGIHSYIIGPVFTSIYGENLYNGMAIDFDTSVYENAGRPMQAYIFENTSTDPTTPFLNATYTDNDDNEQTFACSQGKEFANGAKVVFATCIMNQLDTKSAAIAYNTYMEYLGSSTTIAVNQSPTVTLASNLTVDERTLATLQAEASDSDGDNLTYQWQQISGTTVTLSDATSLTTSFDAPEVQQDTELTFQLTVSDGLDESIATITVMVKQVNRAPTVSAGNNASIQEGNTVNLTGSATDLDNDTLTVSWTQLSGAEVELTGSSTLTASFTAPQVSSSTTLEFQITVSDGNDTVTDTVAITITDTPVTPPTNSGSSGGGGGTTWVISLLALLVWLKRQIQFKSNL